MYEQSDVGVGERTPADLSVGVLWLLFVLAVLEEIATTGPGVPLKAPQPGDALLAGLLGLAVVGAGLFVNSRGRELRPPRTRGHSQLTILSVAAGVAVGAVVLGQAAALAVLDPGIRHNYAMFFPEPSWPPLLRAFGAGVMEEVLFRYVGMAAIALIAARWLAKPQQAYRIGLISSAAIFGLLHTPGLSLVGLVIVLVNAAGGLLFGWIFWHWGLAHAILCHFAAGAIIQSLGPKLFAGFGAG